MFQFAEFCRLCLIQSEQLLYIRSVDDDTLSLQEKLWFLNSKLIPENDPLPKWICEQCKISVNQAYTFMQKSLESLSILNQLITKIKPNVGDIDNCFITNIQNLTKKPAVTEELDPLMIKTEPPDEEELSLDEMITTDEIEIDETNIFIEIKNDVSQMEETTPTKDEQQQPPPIIEEKVIPKKTIELPLRPTCILCKKSFQNLKELNIHRSNKCIIEEDTSIEMIEEEIIQKQIELKNKRKFSCKLCGKIYKKYKPFASHVKTHENEYLLEKEIKMNYVKSMMEGKKIQVYKCGCGQTFCTLKKLKMHQRIHGVKILDVRQKNR